MGLFVVYVINKCFVVVERCFNLKIIVYVYLIFREVVVLKGIIILFILIFIY